MVYLIAVVMGYFIGTNHLVQRLSQSSIGAGYANPTLGLLSSLGGFGGWFCILPAAYFVGADYGSGFVNGLFFVLASFGGALFAGFMQVPGANYLLSAMTLLVNLTLATLVYFLTMGG